MIGIIVYLACAQIPHPSAGTVVHAVAVESHQQQSNDVILILRVNVSHRLKEEQSIGRGAAGGGNDDNNNKHERDNHNNNNDIDNQHGASSYTQRHPNYYYTNGNRVGSSTKSAYSYYDYNDDDSYYNRNKNSNSRRSHIYNYTTKLSDVYWCLLIALGWTIWMIHSIASLRQQHYNTMMSLSDNDLSNPIRNINMLDTMQRLFQTNYSSLLLVRGHVLDIVPNPVIDTDTPIVAVPTYTVIIDYVVERQQQLPLSPMTTTTAMKDDVATLPTISSDIIIPNEFIQIRKHFETTQPNIEVGFGNIELFVLPNDPMCSIIKYDYDEYVRQEERIQRVIKEEQEYRNERRKKRKVKHNKSHMYRKTDSSSSIPEHSIMDRIECLDPNSMTTSNKANRPNLQVDTDCNNNTSKYHEDYNNNEDDDIFGCDMCCSFCDCNYDPYQWKRMSLFFAILLVIASIIGTIHVVRRMDPTKQWLGWISICIGLIVLLPTAMWIHKVMILCHRWSESQPEKQGYIVQSSTMTGTITSYNNNNGDEPNNNNTNTVPNHNTPNLPSMMTLADACMKPSCKDLIDDICDPNCSIIH
jgi:hypothetical protein